MPRSASSRLAYIDWMRGLACLLMFQTHCYDSWLGGEARKSTFFMWSQLGGTLPAPLFLFLAGISFALVTDKLRNKNLPPEQIARTTVRRGAEIFALGLLFRLQEYAIAWGWAPWSDLFRVDILNTIGLSMMLMGVMCWVVLSWSKGVRSRFALGVSAAAVALTISLLTPPLWTSWQPRCPGRWSPTSTAYTTSASRNRGYFPSSPGPLLHLLDWQWDFSCWEIGRGSAALLPSCCSELPGWD